MSNVKTDNSTVVEVIQVPEHVNFTRFVKDKIHKLKGTVTKPIKIFFSDVGIDPKTISINGDDVATVNEVKMKIQSFVNSFAQPRKQLTHFISIPFNYPAVQDSLELFKRKVQSLCPELEDSLFQNPVKVHLTAGVMNLSREQEEEAKSAINSFKEDVLPRIVGPNGQVKVSLEGVSFLGDDRNPSPTKTRVVYAKVTSDHLQEIANSLVKLFVDRKLMDPALQSSRDLSVKLHVTLMNTTFRNREYERQKWTLPKGTKRPDKFFDSSLIVEEFKDFVFARDITVDQIHLSCFKSSTKSDDGYYSALEKLSLQ